MKHALTRNRQIMSTVPIFLILITAHVFAQTTGSKADKPTPTTSTPLKVFLGGDVMVGRYVNGKLRLHGGEHPFQVIGDLAPKEHLTMINLETPFSDEMAPMIKRSKNPAALKVVFRLPTSYASQLVDAGVDVAVLANNHSEDCGQKNIRTTVNTLATAGIKSAGAHHDGDPFAPVLMEHNGHPVAVLAGTILRNYGGARSRDDETLAFYSWKTVKRDLSEAVKMARATHPERAIIVSLHWGKEFALDVGDWSRNIARGLIDAGATVVWGHHSHTFQPIEVYGDGLILYGTGNLVFDMIGLTSRRSGLVETDLVRSKNGRYRVEGFTMHGVTLFGARAPARPSKPNEIKATMKRLEKSFTSNAQPKTVVRKGRTLSWRRQ